MPVHIGFGESIDEYDVLHVLGKGGFASVYKARCLRTNQLVAIKMIDKKLIEKLNMVQRVRQEIEIQARLKHPSVLELYTFFQDDKYVYLVLELAHNGELQRYIREEMRRRMTETEAANILFQIVNGLLYLHAHRIMHRDISLSNMLLSKNMHIKIADFGLATQIQPLEDKHLTMCGTPNYISPEMISRSAHGLAVDVWSVGCIFYTMVVGQPPFDTENIQATLKKVVTASFNIPDYLSSEARDLIEKLLKKNPAERISLELILKHPFMLRYEHLISAAGTAVMTSHYSQNSAFCDSGINTFASNHSNTSRSMKVHSLHKYAYRPLKQIYEYQGPEKQRSSSMQHSSCCFDPQISLRSDVPAELHQMGWKLNDPLPYLQRIEKSYDCVSYPKLYAQNNNEYYLPPKQINNEGRVAALSHNQNISKIPRNTSVPSRPLLVSNEVVKKDIKNLNGRISVPILNTVRLPATRYKTKNAIMNILQNGEVVIEFMKLKKILNKHCVTEVCWISADGMRIIIKQTDGVDTQYIKDLRSEVAGNKIGSYEYSYYNLPKRHWKKYMYGSRFVNLVKAKTPKVTYFSDKAKCHLMESMIDCEVFFYNGAKVVKSVIEGVTVSDRYGRILNEQSQDAKPLLEHQESCYKHCSTLCSALELIQTNIAPYFPIVIGRRVTAEISGNGNQIGLLKHSNYYYSNTNSEKTSDNLLVNTTISRRYEAPSDAQTSNANEINAHPNIVIKRANLQGIGVATELSHGIIQVQFLDGSLISLIPARFGGGLTYTEASGVSTHFSPHDDLPLSVTEKYCQMPQVRRQLQNAPLVDKDLEGNNEIYSPKSPSKLYSTEILTI